MRDIDAVRQRDVITAACVGARLMRQRVVDLADSRQRRFPEKAAGVDVEGAQIVHTLDEQPTSDDLRLGAVAVARQNALMAGTAKPQQTQRRFDEMIARHAGVASVGVFVSPIGTARQGAIARQQNGVAEVAQSSLDPRRTHRRGRRSTPAVALGESGSQAIPP